MFVKKIKRKRELRGKGKGSERDAGQTELRKSANEIRRKGSDGAEAKDKNVSDEVLFAIPFQARLRRKEQIPNVRPFTLVRSRPGIRGKCGPLLAAVR